MILNDLIQIYPKIDFIYCEVKNEKGRRTIKKCK